MTPDDVRAAAEQLVHFHERFAPLFGKEQAQDHAYDYVKGLLTAAQRRSNFRTHIIGVWRHWTSFLVTGVSGGGFERCS